ncbi:MAG: 1-acyl-sn-glycerol-3-phosphate acyltransferase, partial [Rhodobacteraceae bacterium]|nr:1-acyl-sn-glycerol-3-phosphate acyltransferase [Paracoccaceae bacterium]
CNVGVFWPRQRVYREPGLAVIEFLPMLEPGLEKRAFLSQIEEIVETRSNALMAEAGFQVPG